MCCRLSQPRCKPKALAKKAMWLCFQGPGVKVLKQMVLAMTTLLLNIDYWMGHCSKFIWLFHEPLAMLFESTNKASFPVPDSSLFLSLGFTQFKERVWAETKASLFSNKVQRTCIHQSILEYFRKKESNFYGHVGHGAHVVLPPGSTEHSDSASWV